MEVNKKIIGMFNKYLISVKYEDIIKYYKKNEKLITDDTLYDCFINCLDNSFIKLAKWIYSTRTV